MTDKSPDQNGPSAGDSASTRPKVVELTPGKSRSTDPEILQETRWLQAVSDAQDSRAFEQLFSAFAPRLKGFLRRSGCHPDEAERTNDTTDFQICFCIPISCRLNFVRCLYQVWKWLLAH